LRVEPRDRSPGIFLSSVQFSVIATTGIVPPSLEQEKRFPPSARGREARGHGPPKPFSLSIINTIIALLTPSSLVTAPTGCAIEHLPCRTSCTAICPHAWVGCSAGSIEEVASSYPGCGSVSSAGCESTGLPTSIHQHHFNPQSHSVSTFSRRPSKMASVHSRLVLLCCLFARGSMASSSA
jgi:hypothetical protein